MTRQWLDVPPAEMCTEHVKRELMETKQLVDIARGDWDVPTWAGDGTTALQKLHSHAIDGHIDTRDIADRWPRLWAELDRRGETLAIDRDVPQWPNGVPHVYAGRPGADHNRRDLAGRCTKCAGAQAVPA